MVFPQDEEDWEEELIFRSERLLEKYINAKQEKGERIVDINLAQLIATLVAVRYASDMVVLAEHLWTKIDDRYDLAEVQRAEKEFLQIVNYDTRVPLSFIYLVFEKKKLMVWPPGQRDWTDDRRSIKERLALVSSNENYLRAVKILSKKILAIYIEEKKKIETPIKDVILVQFIAVLLAAKYVDEKAVWLVDLYTKLKQIYNFWVLARGEIEFLKTINWKLTFLEKPLMELDAEKKRELERVEEKRLENMPAQNVEVSNLPPKRDSQPKGLVRAFTR
jgi:hypothetical protein